MYVPSYIPKQGNKEMYKSAKSAVIPVIPIMLHFPNPNNIKNKNNINKMQQIPKFITDF